MPNPVRIYVLHHPQSELAERLTNQIYDWFRLASLEGIPVYVRSAVEHGKDRPALPARQKGQPCLEYIVPLVDAHMVRDPVWHAYLADIAKGCQESTKEQSPEWGWMMFPVALDGTAFNLPKQVARMNFIRHGIPGAVSPANPDQPTPAEKKVARAHEALEVEETLKHLTEALARDLNVRLFDVKAADRFKIFISYARADGTEVPKALRTYIQSQTQCLVFFDENDIGYGQAFDNSIADNVGDLASAMIVVCGDHYADRPWCRWEIRRFTRPRPVALTRDGDVKKDPCVQVFQPVMVVDAMTGPKLTRVVPELAQAPVARWTAGGERTCFSALMREVVFGLRDVMVARTMDPDDFPDSAKTGVVVNRLPGPVALARVFPTEDARPRGSNFTVHHPGHGLPLAELRLLEKTFPKVRFQAFRDINRNLPPEMKRWCNEMENDSGRELPLKNKVIAISTARNRPDLAARGYLTQHQDEALIHMLRPLLRLGADLLYGGSPPRSGIEPEYGENASPSANRNITLTLLQLLSDERRVIEIEDVKAGEKAAGESGSLMFNLSSWPLCTKIKPRDEAAWISACRIRRVMPEDAQLPPWEGALPEKGDPLPPGYRRYQALTMSHVRKLLANGFACPVPGDLKRRVQPAAFVFLGGAVGGFKGVMPGVMEEFLHATQVRPALPIYLVGGLGGATEFLAKALLQSSRNGRPPAELTHENYKTQSANDGEEYQALMKELTASEVRTVRQQFDQLWSVIRARHGQDGLHNLFSNGLSHAENTTLLSTPDTMEAVRLIWEGMSRVLLAPEAPVATASKSRGRKTTTSAPPMLKTPKRGLRPKVARA